MHKRLAKIESTMLGYEDHGILTCMLNVAYEGSSGQGIGGYGLDTPIRDADDKFVERLGTAEGMQFVANIIKTCGVRKWEDLVGRLVWVLTEDDSYNARVLGVQGVETDGTRKPFIFKSLWPEEPNA